MIDGKAGIIACFSPSGLTTEMGTNIFWLWREVLEGNSKLHLLALPPKKVKTNNQTTTKTSPKTGGETQMMLHPEERKN